MGNVTVKESGEMVNIISPNVNNITSFKVHFSPKQEGEGDPSPENIRNITGWNGAEVFAYGKNLVNVSAETRAYANASVSSNNKFIENDSIITIFGVANGGYQVPCKPNTQYTYSFEPSLKASGFYIRVWELEEKYDGVKFPSDSLLINRSINSSLGSVETFTTKASTHYLIIGFYIYSTSAATAAETGITISNFQLELGDTRTSYEPYQGINTLIDWTDSAGTIYGGYIDLITGEIWKSYDVASDLWKNWDTSGELDNYIRKRLVTPYRPVGGNASSTSLCNITGTYLWSNVTESTHFYVGNSGNTVYAILPKTLDENQEVQISYKLTEPVYVTTLSPTQLSTLKGQNNFWSNADYVEIEYELTETFDIQKAKRKIILNQPHIESMSSNIATFNTDMVGKLKECKINFLPVQEGEGDPSPENVREITGWNGFKVYKTQKNMAHVIGYSANTMNTTTSTRYVSNNFGTTISTINYTLPDTSVVVTQTQYPNTSVIYHYKNGYFCIGVDNLVFGQRYDISFKISNITNNPLNAQLNDLRISNPGGSINGNLTVDNNTGVVIFKNVIYDTLSTIPERCTFDIRNCGMSFTFSEFMVTPANKSDGVFEPYNNQSNIINVTFPDTFYGGYIDLISGELVQEWKKVYIKDYTWSNYSAKLRYYVSLRTKNDDDYRQDGTIIYSDTLTPRNDGRFGEAGVGYITYYKKNTTANASNRNYIWITLPEVMEMTEANEWIKTTYPDASIVYKLETPIIYQLTPQQLTTLRGINNIWSSANGEVEIKFWTH